MKKRTKPVYVVINIESFETKVFGNKTDIARLLGVHRNTITFKNNRRTIDNYIIIETNLI